MKQLMYGLLVVLFIFVVILIQQNRMSENFVSRAHTNVDCPRSVRRGADGRILVEPGKLSFETMADYVAYLSNLYSKGATCLAPKVEPYAREPIDGILGGLVKQSEVQVPLAMGEQSEQTYAKTPIQKLDDYEYTRVFESESQRRNNLGREVKSELMNQYKLDWANLPFNSEARAAQEDEFVAGVMDNVHRDPKTGVFFKNMDGGDLLPPDVEAQKMREDQILSAYRPTDITQHRVDNETHQVAKLVNDMYAADKDWEPVVTKMGENKWEVTELRPKPRKEIYEDAQTIRLVTAQEKGFIKPAPTINILNRLQDDPYFDKSGVGDVANDRFWQYKDFNKWTPNLERMFAPTETTRDWH